jgi:nuclear pore complex protein Nup133
MLAEHHYDWESLVFLCHHPRVGRGGAQIQKYIERHGEQFAFVLYQWYIDNGASGDYSALLEVFGSFALS